ncbi:hypothetical protein DFR86_01155 [Acidianus sulfidivorans JP7]|uniref:HEPN domain-containing protein n=1 Tax=Acidianus sulfidivorans JP7 TaxID=619593 RepID=A0A2U9IJX7_9CREN|nr:hypothetical protein [Acidianus sulfidivorans]AWR96285.1 hypothetical protein DFR86_01155 [Acidianus sulfidivorans JP7]
MPIRTEEQYALMSYRDFLVAYERLKKGNYVLSAFRAYKSLRRMLQSLAMKHDLHSKVTPCAVPKADMIKVAKELDDKYSGILEMTRNALKLFDEWKNKTANKEDIINLLLSLNFNWISNHLSPDYLNKIEIVKEELKRSTIEQTTNK